LPLADRIVFDTAGRLIEAAQLRFIEADWLRDGGFLLAALYLYGYSVEMVLGASLARIRLGKASDEEIGKVDRDTILKQARGRSKMMRDDLSHPIDGLASLLIADRADRRAKAGLGRTPEEHQTEALLADHARSIGANWRPRLRYQSLSPTEDEVEAVRDAAGWLLSRIDQL
jgi:hypothetical protein